MKPFSSTDAPALSISDRLEHVILAVEIEPRFVTIRHRGEIVAASSCVMRAETLAGAVFCLPHADVDMARLSKRLPPGGRPGARAAWVFASERGAEAAAFSTEGADAPELAGRIAFDAKTVDITVAPTRAGEQPYSLM